jgi:hypothetical protein
MEHSPKDDRSGTSLADTQRKRQAQNDRGNQRGANNPPSPAEQSQQQQSRRMGDFAPGEDGECH